MSKSDTRASTLAMKISSLAFKIGPVSGVSIFIVMPGLYAFVVRL